MRNLKRVLSLALATVMLLGMMVIGAGAADAKTEAPKATAITDLDKVVNKEAVSLMVDLGIIVGKPDGTFAPTETVDRATMAKLITYIQMGDVDQGVFKGTTSPLTDINGNWAEGYIKYCYANGIVAGTGDGKFAPASKVTVAAAAKMLLVALGYDAKASKYEGDAMWSVNIMRDAQLAGLLKSIDQKSTDELTRDNAAQMIYNALFAKTVKPDFQYDMGVKYLKEYKTDANTLGESTYKLAQITGTLTANDANTSSATLNKSSKLDYSSRGAAQAGQVLEVASKMEDLGKQVTLYVKLKDVTRTVDGLDLTASNIKSIFSKNVVVASANKVVAIPSNIVAASTPKPGSNVRSDKWLSDNGLKFSGKADAYTFANYTYTANNANLAEAALIAINSTDTAYVIDGNSDGVIDGIMVNTMVIDFVTGDMKTNVSGANTTVYVPGVTTGYVSTANVTGYEGLKKNDVVFTLTVNTDVLYITKGTMLTGVMTGFSGTGATGKILVDGTSTAISPLADASVDTVEEIKALDTTYSKKIDFTLDPAGKIAFAKIASGESVTSTAVLLQVAKVSGAFEDTNYQAKLLFTDGTTQIVDVNHIYNAGATADQSSTLAAKAAFAKNATAYQTNYDFVNYTVDSDGKYNLVLVDAGTKTDDGKTYASVALSTATITSGKPVFTGTTVGNSNTKFIVANYAATGNKVTGFTVYDGIAKAPAYNGDGVGTVLTANGTASIVFLTAGAQSNIGAGNYLYITAKQHSAKVYSAADKTYTVNAFVDGVLTEGIVIKNTAMNTIVSAGLYEIALDGSTITGASATTAIDSLNTWTGVKFMNGTVAFNTSLATASPAGAQYYTYTEDTKVYVLDTDGVATSVNVSDIVTDSNDTVKVYGDSTKMIAKQIIITKVDLTYGTAVTAVKYDKDAATSWANALTAGDNDLKATFTTNGDKLKVQATVAAGYKATVTITGNTAAVPAATVTSANAQGGVIVAEYIVNTADLATAKQVKVVIIATDGENEISTTYTINVKS